MADEDFTIESLADYLHLHPDQIARLADRGQVPGRRVGGAWRFSPHEIHHWLEARVGVLDDAGLLQLEGALRRSAGEPAGPSTSIPCIATLLPQEAIAVPLAARTRSSVITSMVDLAAQTGWVWDPEALADAVRRREDLFPTALDSGVALLHPRRPLPAIVAEPFLAFGRTSQGIPFSGQRGQLTDLFFLILSVDDAGHLRVLARLSRLLAAPGFHDALRGAADAAAVRAAIASAEEQLPE
ncbi:MAG: PTS sugar transporter subunit IIA [Pirellulales bacterium]|nr:PTS sugar transporter subunit IIA [Pirellulales bacterium]